VKNRKGIIVLVVSLVVLGLIYLVLPDRIAVLFWLTGDFVYAPREFVFVCLNTLCGIQNLVEKGLRV
jgi:hypothetical protein